MRVLILSVLAAFVSGAAQAFCGFYVARADGDLFNEASKVVYTRDGDRSVITMASDYRGPAAEFAMVVPAPEVLARDQVRTVNPATLVHLDEYTAPRLVEYFDDDPCAPTILRSQVLMSVAMEEPVAVDETGVTVEAEYEVGIYDVVILSAEHSDGLATWLREERYNIPAGAEEVLDDYIAGGMKFFVARVNLDRHAAGETQELPPLQLSFEGDAFMLPLQLGKVNAENEQSVLLMTLTRTGRVEASNYDNVRIPSDFGIPALLEDDFGAFYKALFDDTARPNTVVTEYAWDMAWCDPCAADPLSVAQLKELGADWVEPGQAQDVYVTRMHFKYGAGEFMNDLALSETGDRKNFQGRYVITHPFTETVANCPIAKGYYSETRFRMRSEVTRAAEILGVSAKDLHQRVRASLPEQFEY